MATIASIDKMVVHRNSCIGFYKDKNRNNDNMLTINKQREKNR